MPNVELCLLAALPGGDQILAVFLWFAVAVVVASGGFALAVAVRRRVQREDGTPTFTIQDLREMRARGQITDREFASMRAVVLARTRADELDGAARGGRGSAAEDPDSSEA